jgi:hypothetical protein
MGIAFREMTNRKDTRSLALTPRNSSSIGGLRGL